jgi:general secretion pathway protein J
MRTVWLNRQQAAGFTLIEILVALALLSLLSVGLITTMRIAQSIDGRTQRLERSLQDMVITHRFLRQAVGSAYPKLGADPSREVRGLEADSKSVRLLTTLGQGTGNLGLRRVEVRWEPDSGGIGPLVAYVSPEPARNLSMQDASREVLVEGVREVDWSFRAADDSTVGWTSQWQDAELPRLVRLQIRLGGPAALEWPELIVATRITNDANCEFDVVAQACRGQVHRWLP